MEACPLYKSTSCARLCTTKISMASSLGRWRVNPLISFWTELVRAAKLWGSLHQCQLMCILTSPLDLAWETTPNWPLISWNPFTGCQVMGRSSSISADLYSDLAFGLGIRNYPKLTPHLLKYFQWFQSYREVLQGWPSKGLEGLGPNLSLLTYKIHILQTWVDISRYFPKANFFGDTL